MARRPPRALPSVVLRGPGQEAALANLRGSTLPPCGLRPDPRTITNGSARSYAEVRPEGPGDLSPGAAINERDAEAITLRLTAPPLTAR